MVGVCRYHKTEINIFGITKVNGHGSCKSKGLRDFLKGRKKVKSFILVLNEGGVVRESEVFD